MSAAGFGPLTYDAARVYDAVSAMLEARAPYRRRRRRRPQIREDDGRSSSRRDAPGQTETTRGGSGTTREGAGVGIAGPGSIASLYDDATAGASAGGGPPGGAGPGPGGECPLQLVDNFRNGMIETEWRSLKGGFLETSALRPNPAVVGSADPFYVFDYPLCPYGALTAEVSFENDPGYNAGVAVRTAAHAGAGGMRGYGFGLDPIFDWSIWRWDGDGSRTNLALVYPPGWSPGDTLALRADAGVLTAFHNGVDVGSVIDATYSAGGWGLWANASTPVINRFRLLA